VEPLVVETAVAPGTTPPLAAAVVVEESNENAIAAKEVEGLSQAQIVARRFFRHRGAMIAAAVLIGIILLVATSIGWGPIPGWWATNHTDFNDIVNPQGAPTMHLREMGAPTLWYALGALVALGLLAAAITWLMSAFTGRSERAANLATPDDGWTGYRANHVATPRADRLFNLAARILKWAIWAAVAAGLLYLITHLEVGSHPFGQDNLGRDGFARVMRGTQTSLTVMTIIGITSTLIGVILGAISGFFRGHIDNVIMRFTDMVITIPTIIVGSILGVMVGGGNAPWIFNAIPRAILLALMLSLMTWTSMCRLVRAQFLALREQEFVDAARVAGASNFRIMFKHILPNAVGVIIVNASLLMASAILLETALSFLGFGIRAPEVSLGQIINEYQAAFQTRPWLFWWPGFFIVAIALCINFIGDGLRDAFDPRQRRIPTAKALARADAKKQAKLKAAPVVSVGSASTVETATRVVGSGSTV
jgi:peptide/nickel transport system permease protein